MTKLEIIKEMLSDKYSFTDKKCLIEEEKDEKGRPFKQEYPIVKTHSINYELYRFDEKAFPFFNEISGLKAMCDYILFAEEKDHLYIFIIELKWGVASSQKQLNAGSAFADYLLNTAKRIGKNLDEKVYIKKVRLSNTHISKFSKRNINEKNAVSFDKDNYCEYPYSKFLLARLME